MRLGSPHGAAFGALYDLDPALGLGADPSGSLSLGLQHELQGARLLRIEH